MLERLLLLCASTAPSPAALALATHDLSPLPSSSPVQVRLLPAGLSYAQARALAAPAGPSAASPGSALLTTNTLLPLAEASEADAPIDVAVTPDGQLAIVVCRDSDALEFVNAVTGARLGRVLVDDEPLDIELTPDGSKALVACARANTLCVVDVASRTLSARVQGVGVEPYRVLVSADGSRAVVGSVSRAANPTQGQFTRVNIAAASVIDALPTVRQTPSASEFTIASFEVAMPRFAITPDARRLVYADAASGRTRVYDLDLGAQLLEEGAFGEFPFSVSVSADGAKAAVAAFTAGGTSELRYIDLASATSVPIALSSQLYLADVGLTANGSRALIGTFDGLRLVDLPSGVQHAVSTGVESIARIQMLPGGQRALTSMYETKIVDMISGNVVSTVAQPFLRHIGLAASGTRAVATRAWQEEALVALPVSGPSFGAPVRIALGELRELDGPFDLDVSADGLRAAVWCQVSNNFALVDLENRSVGTITTVRAPVYTTAMDVDAGVAVASSESPPRLRVVDLARGEVVATLALAHPGYQVLLSPDARTAYVLTTDPQTGNSQVEFIALDGAASHLSASLPLALHATRLFLSPAGDALAVGAFSPGKVLWIDLASHSIARIVNTDPGPYDGAFTPDGQRLILRSGSLQAHLVEVHGTSTVSQRIFAVPSMRSVAFDASGTHAYFTAPLSGSSQLAVYVVDMQTLQLVATIPLSTTPGAAVSHFPTIAERLGDQLLVAESESFQRIWRVRMAGPATTLVEDVPGSFFSSHAAVSWSLGTLVHPAPIFDDALLMTRFGGNASSYCDPATPNSTGQPSQLTAYGTFLAGDQRVRLACRQLPPHKLALLLVGDGSATSAPPFGIGTLCVSGNVARYDALHVNTGAAGSAAFDIDIRALPFTPAIPVLAGQTWNFQVWHRDLASAGGSNLSNAVAVTFD